MCAVLACRTARPLRFLSRAVLALGISILALGAGVSRAAAVGGTVLTGGLLGNTVWTTAGSPYTLTGDVTVPAGGVLTVEPGVSVIAAATDDQFGGSDPSRVELLIDGSLAAGGTSVSPVTFEALIVRPKDGGTAALARCIFRGGSIRPRPGGVLTLTDSRLLDLDGQMALTLPAGDCRIERNMFRHAPPIVISTSGSTKVYITDNLFYASAGSIKNEGSPPPSATLVHGNTFMLPCEQRSTVLPLSAYLELSGAQGAMDATSNYWPGLDASSVHLRIWDRTDNLAIGGWVPYEPVLSGPATEAPLFDDSLKHTASLGLTAPTTVIPAGTYADLRLTVATTDSRATTVTIEIQSSSDGVGWTTVSSGWRENGAAATTESVIPSGTTYYRAVAPGGYELAPATSEVVTVHGELPEQVLTDLELTAPAEVPVDESFVATLTALDQTGAVMAALPPEGLLVNITTTGGLIAPAQIVMYSGQATFLVAAGPAPTAGTIVVGAGTIEDSAEVAVVELVDRIPVFGAPVASSRHVAYGSKVRLHATMTTSAGTLAGRSGLSVLRRDGGSSTWVTETTAVAWNSASQTYEATVTCLRNADYALYFPGDADFTSAESGSVAIETHAAVGRPRAPSSVREDRTFTVYGYLKPRHTSGSYPVRIYKYRKVSGHWKSYGYVKAKASNYSSYTKYSVRMKLTRKATWRLRAYAPADSGHVATWSSTYDYVKAR